MRRSTVLFLAFLLFFLSGVSGLIYEIVWTRRLTLVFGHSVLAISTVLAAFMAGLGLGSLAGGRWADASPGRTSGDYLRAYAWAEAGAGLAGLLSLPVLVLVSEAYVWLAQQGWSGLPLQLACLLLSLTALLPPTLAMGCTLPILARGLSAHLAEGPLVGVLYGANTAGACLGAALTGYALLPWFGLSRALLLAASLNLLLAFLARLVSRRLDPASLPLPPAPAARGSRLILAAVGLAGAASMILQVGWTRALVLAFGSSTYAFSAILTVYLAGLGAGSVLYALTPARRLGLPLVLLGAAALAAGTSAALGFLPYLVFLTSGATSFLATMFRHLGLTALLILGPTMALGLAFPVSVQLYRAGGLGGRVAVLYGTNTAGCVVGSVLAGFWLLPACGALWTLQIACLLLILAGILAGLGHEAPRARLVRMGVASLLGLGVLGLPEWNPALISAGVGLYAPHYASVAALSRTAPPFWVHDGRSSSVALYCSAQGQLSMRVNGKVDASTDPDDLSTMYLTGYLPALYTRPRKAAVIGLGGGMTLEALCQVPGMQQVDCAELEGGVIAAQRYWKGYNSRVADDPRVRILETDGRTFLQSGRDRYDIIASEPSNVWMAGIGNLYTREFYEICRERLAEGGVMAQWFQNYAVSGDEVGTVVRTFFEVFPHGSVWATSPNEGDILLLGSAQPLTVDAAWLKQLIASPSVQRHLFSIDLWEPEALLGHYVSERGRALTHFGEAVVNTDDRPSLEFRAARRPVSDSRFTGLSEKLMNLGQPLPPGLATTPARLEAAWLGWMACRPPQELARLLKAYPQLLKRPLVYALTHADPGTKTRELIRGFSPALPLTPVAGYLLGRLLEDRGLWKLAEESFRMASSRPFPGGESTLWSRLGLACWRQGKLEEATQAMLRSVETGGGYASQTLLGDLWLRRERPSVALPIYTRAAAENQVYVPAVWGRAQSLLALGRPVPATRAFQEVLDLAPSHLLALMNVAYARTQSLDFPGALRSYRRVLEYYPDNQAAQASINQLMRTRPGVRFTPVP